MSYHSQGSSVLFVNTKDVYPPKQSLNCKFTVDGGEVQTVDETCWIGIYKVGWEMLDDYFSRKFLLAERGLIEMSSKTQEVCFSEAEIPEENDEEFYQFCFVTGQGVMLGASCPFQISQNKDNGSLSSSLLDLSGATTSQEKASQDNFDLEWCPWFEISGEDIDDTVLVHNKTTLLEKSLAKVIQDNNMLRESVECKVSELEILNGELFESQEQINAAKDLLNDKRRQQEADIEQIDKMAEEIVNASRREEELNLQVHEMRKVIKNQNDDLEKFKQDIDMISEQLEQERQVGKVKCEEYEIKLQKSIESLKIMEMALIGEKEALCTSENNHQQKIQSLTDSLSSLISELATSKECIDKLQSEKDDTIKILRNELQAIDKEKADLIDTIIGKEETINELEKRILFLNENHQKELQNLQEDLNISAKKLDDQMIIVGKMQHATKNQLELEKENCNLKMEIQMLTEASKKAQERVDLLDKKLLEMKEENILLNEKSHGHNGARHALQVAYVHTQRQLAQVREERDTIAHQYHSFRQQSLENEDEIDVKELKNLVEDLKLRLCIGANAYKEKYLECRKMQNEINRMKITAAKGYDKTRATDSPATDECQKKGAIVDKFSNGKNLSSMENEVKNNEGTRFLELQKALEGKNSKLHQLKMNYEKSLFELTRQINSLQDQLQTKDDSLQNAKHVADEAKAEANLLKRELVTYKQGKNTKEGKSNDRSERSKLLDCQDVTTEASQQKENLSSKKTNVQTQLSNLKIFHPPKSITGSESLCLHDPYVHTLRPAVSMSEAQMEGMMSPTDSAPNTWNAQHVAPTASVSVLSGQTLDCPVCGLKFPSDCSELTASNHVNSHFPEISGRRAKKGQQKQ